MFDMPVTSMVLHVLLNQYCGKKTKNKPKKLLLRSHKSAVAVVIFNVCAFSAKN